MTFSANKEGLKFNRTWIDRIMGKVDKNQGVANAGKVLGIGNDGQVVPVEQSGGGSGSTLEPISNITTTELLSKVKVGDNLILNINYRYCSAVNASGVTPVTVNDVTHFTGDLSPTYSSTVGTFFTTVRYIDSNGVYLTTNPVLDQYEEQASVINGTQYPLTINSTVFFTSITSSGVHATTRGVVILGGNSGVIPRVRNLSNSTTSSIDGYIIHNS